KGYSGLQGLFIFKVRIPNVIVVVKTVEQVEPKTLGNRWGPFAVGQSPAQVKLSIGPVVAGRDTFYDTVLSGFHIGMENLKTAQAESIGHMKGLVSKTGRQF